MTATLVPGDDAGPSPAPTVSVAAGPPVAVAWLPVGALAAVMAVVLAVASTRYGWFGDELYFLSAGARPALGYADQPPMLPMLAAAADAVAPGSLTVFRLPAVLLTASQVVIAAMIAAELGGGRRAQVVAAAATTIGWYLLAGGQLLATSTIDPFFWSVLLLLFVRWTRTRRDRLLLAAGVVSGLALWGKFLVPVLLVAIAVGMAVAGPRDVFRRPLLWVGMAVAALSTLPTLWWQATHGWPQSSMGSVVAGEAGLFGNRWQFVPRALLYAGVLPGAVLVVVGVWGLLRLEALRPWRWVGIATLVAALMLLAAAGRPYYLSGFHAMLFAAGAVTVGHLVARAEPPRRLRWWRWTLSVPSFVTSAVVVAVLVLPIGPSQVRAPYDFQTMGQVGWPAFADAVAATWSAQPPDGRARAAVVTYSYWYAAALERDGPARGLPPTVYSPHRGFGFFGAPPDTAATVLLVGPVRWARTFCADLRSVPPYVGRDVTPVNDRVPMSWCRPSEPWSRAWPRLQYMD